MKTSLLIAIALSTSCAADNAATPASEVGITVLPVSSASEPAPLARVETSAVASASPDVGPRDPVAAERDFTEARSLMNSGRVDEACALFSRSYEADPALGTLFNIADCQEKLGNIPAACKAYREVEVEALRQKQDTRGSVARLRAEKLGCR
jgi:hypothetical protein